MYSLQRYRRPIKECNSDTPGTTVAQLLLQEFEQWDAGHPSFSSCWHPVHWEGTVTKPCKTPLFSLSLVTRILQEVSSAAGCPDIRAEQPLTDCTHCCGENNWERQPHSRDTVLGPPLSCKKGSGGEGWCTRRGNAHGHPFLPAAVKSGRRQQVQFCCSPGMLYALPSPQTGICMTRFD